MYSERVRSALLAYFFDLFTVPAKHVTIPTCRPNTNQTLLLKSGGPIDNFIFRLCSFTKFFSDVNLIFIDLAASHGEKPFAASASGYERFLLQLVLIILQWEPLESDWFHSSCLIFSGFFLLPTFRVPVAAVIIKLQVDHEIRISFSRASPIVS
jgi:hypothetical protein